MEFFFHVEVMSSREMILGIILLRRFYFCNSVWENLNKFFCQITIFGQIFSKNFHFT
jgi:hypothetical protein